MLSEQMQEEEVLQAGTPHHKINASSILSAGLADIEADLLRHDLAAPGKYLLGLVQKDRNKRSEAKESL